MTTAARREQAARALCDLIDIDFDDDATSKAEAMQVVDAVLNACLPSLRSFENALDDYEAGVAQVTRYAHRTPSAREKVERNRDEARSALIALIYGDAS